MELSHLFMISGLSHSAVLLIGGEVWSRRMLAEWRTVWVAWDLPCCSGL